jgi:hypothetical protein
MKKNYFHPSGQIWVQLYSRTSFKNCWHCWKLNCKAVLGKSIADIVLKSHVELYGCCCIQWKSYMVHVGTKYICFFIVATLNFFHHSRYLLAVISLRHCQRPGVSQNFKVAEYRRGTVRLPLLQYNTIQLSLLRLIRVQLLHRHVCVIKNKQIEKHVLKNKTK